MNSLMPSRNVLLVGDQVEAKREEIRAYFHRTYDVYERLFEPLRSDATYYLRPEALRHPLIFYFGHTATFYVNKLVLAKALDSRINPAFESIFAIGVDEMSWDDLNDEHYDWPSVDEVRQYRKQVRDAIDALIDRAPLSLPIDWSSPFWAILMGIEHERIHLETSSVLIRQLPIEEVSADEFWPCCKESGSAPDNELLEVPGGLMRLGKKSDDRLYGWDNEYGQRDVEVAPFKASKYLVTNQEYLEFIDAGGYRTPQWWTEEGKSWLAFAKRDFPVFWVEAESGFRYRTMLEEIDMPWDWPVDVNYLEAKAFCTWKALQTGKPIRLPSEDEWHRILEEIELDDEPEWKGAPGNINLEFFASACPVTRFSHGGFHDPIGNVWQWTETPISGFPGFAVHPLYDDFSTPTFDNQHNIIKGGSWISTGNEATRDARYAFRRHFFQHAGFRYVESDAPVEVEHSLYETDELLSQYCEAHYGPDYFGVANFARRCAQICDEAMGDRPRRKALDLGCAVGRSSLELARSFDSVTGLDFSARFIRLALEMKERGMLKYVLPEEGDLITFEEHDLAELGLEDLGDKVEFFQSDACNLKSLYQGYDLVLAANLIDRLYDPKRFLQMIHERIVEGGLLVLTSPYTWLEEHTERELWVGGFKRDGERVTTLDGLEEILGEHFKLVAGPTEVPFVIRETKRKFQHTVSQLTIWEKQ